MHREFGLTLFKGFKVTKVTKVIKGFKVTKVINDFAGKRG